MPEIEKKEGEVVVEKVEKKEEEKTPESKPKTAAELKAEAETVEAEIEALEKEKKEGELAQNQARRLEKAKAKLAKLKGGNPEGGESDDDEPAPRAADTIDTRDLITLGKLDLAEDSEKAKILLKYKKGGLIKNFAEGLTHPGVKAEFDALDAKGKAKSVINENDSDEVKLKTEQEVIAQYRSTGEVPTDPKLQKKVADANLKEMGL